jgi:hypothetical protein
MKVFTERNLIIKYNSLNLQQLATIYSDHKLFYQILRKARMYLRVQPNFDPHFDEHEEDVDGSRQRFAHVFRNTWLSIGRPMRGKPRPVGEPNYRKNMLDFWRRGRDGMPWIPQISLEDGVSKVGSYQRLGGFEFNSRAVKLVDKAGFLPDLIAHEFAHAWCDTQASSYIRNGHATQDQIEGEANGLATEWGFRMAPLELWWNNNRSALRSCGVQVDGVGTF